MTCELQKCGHCKSLEEDDQCGLPEHRFCYLCQLKDEVDLYYAADEKLREENALLRRALVIVERACPCGARPESLSTHPHVGGCVVGEMLHPRENVGCIGCDEHWPLYPNGVTHEVPEVKHGGYLCRTKKAERLATESK